MSSYPLKWCLLLAALALLLWACLDYDMVEIDLGVVRLGRHQLAVIPTDRPTPRATLGNSG